MAVTLSISITQNSQNITNNTSNVTVKVTAKWTGGSHNAVVNASGVPQAKGWCNINGTKYEFASTFNEGETTSGSEVVYSKTLNITHADDGTKTLSVSASYSTGVSSGTITASASKVLTTIPRKSTLSVANGTLGAAQTLTVTRKATSFTHTITYKCGSASGTICTKSTSTSISFTPPLSLANQNTTGTTVSVVYTITTYSGSTSIGSNTYTVTCSIPSSVKPSVSLSLADAMGYLSTYGKYIQGLSKIKGTITASGSYGSTIKSYKATANGSTYTSASFTTGLITGSGTLTVSVTVTDSRGRTATASQSISVYAYTEPKISIKSVERCDADGTSNSSGAYLAIKFDASITSLDNKNTADYTLQYKKAADSSYTVNSLSNLDGVYSLTDSVLVIPAETTSSYDILLIAADAFKSAKKATTGSSIKKLWSILKKGFGFAFGKIAELENVLDIGFQTKFSGGILQPVLANNTDLDTVTVANVYSGKAASTSGYTNCPITTGTSFTLEVMSAGADGQLMQRITSCTKGTPVVYVRHYYSGAWGSWITM